MERKAETFLKTWFESPHRKPLILRGARQVGKSTLVRLFCKKNHIELFEINLEKSPLGSFESKNISIKNIIQEIELMLGKPFIPSLKSLIFIDEIQSQPRAITALRYFYEDHPNIAVISAGSLLEIVLNKEKEISFPVGRVEFYYLGPMVFSEFMGASHNNLLKNEFSKPIKTQNSDALHEHLNNHYKKFLAVGGMPEAVKRYFESEKLVNVQSVHRSIIETYKNDFTKYGSRVKVDRLDKIFSAVPFVVGQKLKYANIDPNLKARDVKAGLELLELAQVISSCIHSNCSGHPIESQADSSVRKLFFLDIGLWNYIMKTNLQSIIDDKLLLTNGVLAEQFVAQHLLYQNKGISAPTLNYWLKDKKTSKAEVDFVLEHKERIIPIEVKAGKSSKLKSLYYFLSEKKQNLGIKISTDPYQKVKIMETISDGQKAIIVNGILISIPIYYVEYILDFINSD